MIGDYVRSLEGVATLGAVLLLASLAFFVGIIIRVLRTPSHQVDRLAHIPFEDDDTGSVHHKKVAP